MPRKKLDRVEFVRITDTQEHWLQFEIDRGKALAEDPNKGVRQKLNFCRLCYYSPGRLGGAAITTQPCGLCGVEQSFGSTATDVLCPACAKAHSLCKRCGADRELRPRRRKWPDAAP
jgi:hypothetical protein